MNIQQPLVSVVIATYNRAHTLAQSITSVLNQSESRTEVLIIDDGSTDNTEEVVRAIDDSRVKYIKGFPNKGSSVARNRGIQGSCGEFIMIWDSDDVLYPGALESALNVFTKDPSLDVVSAPARIMIKGKEARFARFAEGVATLDDILCKNIPSNEKVRIARAETMKKVTYKSRNIDFLVNVELAELGRWYHLDIPLADVFNNPHHGSLTASRRQKNAELTLDRTPHLHSFIRHHGARLKDICPTRFADYCYGIALGMLLSGDIQEARRYATAAIRSRPSAIRYWGVAALTCFPAGSYILKSLYTVWNQL
jgi:glycosyltransferase involved in cell wall biosynthesis